MTRHHDPLVRGECPEIGEVDYTLSDVEVEVFASAEDTIERGLSSFLDVGDALAEIREQRLYRVEHPTFEAYCAARWGFTDRRARQLMTAAATVGTLPTGTMVPVSERQARALAVVPEADRAEVMTRAEAAGTVTAASIETAAADLEAERTATPDMGQGEPSPPAPSRKPPTLTPKSETTLTIDSMVRVGNAARAFIEVATTERLEALADEDWTSFQALAELLGRCTQRIAEGGRQRRQLRAIAGGKK